MNIKTKYDIGQELYFIVPEKTQIKVCEFCGHKKHDVVKFKVNENPIMIESIQITAYGITYFNDLGGHFAEDFDMNEQAYFATPEQAQTECDRRNCPERSSGLKGDG